MAYPQSHILQNKMGPLGAYQVSPERPDTLAHIVLLHGSSIGMTHPFMQQLAACLIDKGMQVSLFDFNYMQKVVITGRKRPPARVPQLLHELQQWLSYLGDHQPLWLVGKSLGGRLASILAQEADNSIAGWVAVGYPFHPLGKPQQLRVEHLLQNTCPGLIVQGTRDRMGLPNEIAHYGLPKSIRMHWLADMDHGLQPYKRAPLSQQQAISQAADWVYRWIGEVPI